MRRGHTHTLAFSCVSRGRCYAARREAEWLTPTKVRLDRSSWPKIGHVTMASLPSSLSTRSRLSVERSCSVQWWLASGLPTPPPTPVPSEAAAGLYAQTMGLISPCMCGYRAKCIHRNYAQLATDNLVIGGDRLSRSLGGRQGRRIGDRICGLWGPRLLPPNNRIQCSYSYTPGVTYEGCLLT